MNKLSKTKANKNKLKSENERSVLFDSFMNAPAGIAVFKGDTHVYEFANAEHEKLVNKKITIGKTVQDLFPEFEQQGLIQIFNNVFATGEPFIANEYPVELINQTSGNLVLGYYNLVVQPLKDKKGNTARLMSHAIEVTQQVQARKQIEINEEFNRTILQSSPDCLKVLDAQGRIQFMNLNGLCQMEIDDFSEYKNKDWCELWGSENKELVKDAINKALRGETAQFTAFCPTAKGTSKWWDVTVSAVGQPGEAVQQIISVSRDITEQRISELQIKESEQKYRELFNAIDQGLSIVEMIFDENGKPIDYRFIEINQAFHEQTGLPDLTNKSAKETLPDLDDFWFETYGKVALTGNSIRFTNRAAALNSWFDVFAFKLGDKDSKKVAILFTNITERILAEEKIKNSEEKIRNFILQAPVAMCLFRGPQYIIEIVNEDMLGIWDKTLDEVVNKPVFEALPEAKNQGFENYLANVYTTGDKFTSYGVPITLNRNDKPKTSYVNLVYQAYREADGTISGIVAVVSDATEQVLATQQIKSSENQLRTFADSIQNLAWIANGEGWIYWYNKQWFDYTGTTLEEMEGYGWEKVHHPNHIAKVIEFVKEAWKNDEPFEMTFPLRKHDGEFRWFLTRAYPVKDANGNIEKWIGTNTDITGQKSFAEELEKRVEERTVELTERNMFIETLINSSIDVIIAFDKDLRYLTMNRAAADVLSERFPDGVIGKKMDEVVPHVHQTGAYANAVSALEGNIISQKEYKSFYGNKYFDIDFIPLRNEKEVYAVMTVSRDVTKNVLTAADLKTKNLELEHTNAELASFSYIASHDLKEPLRKIQAFSKRIVETEKFSDVTQDYFNRIISAAERMQNLIDSLLNYSHANTTEMVFKPCNLNSIVQESISDLNLTITENQATIAFKNLPTINGIGIQLIQLFTNIIDNAIKYSQTDVKPVIKITSSIIKGKNIIHLQDNNTKEFHVIKVADNGIGFEKEYASKIFEVFQRLHPNNQYTGTGIGLAIVKKIVTNHDGFIVAEGKLNKGSIFTIYIPKT